MTLSKQTVLLAGIAAFTILAVWVVASGKKQSPPTAPSNNQTQTNEGGNVTVAVTPQELTPEKPAMFEVVFDTHSVDLDFDAAAASDLRDDKGTSYGVPVWNGDPPGGHHRKGTLTFPAPLESTSVKLTLRDISGIKEREFEWKL